MKSYFSVHTKADDYQSLIWAQDDELDTCFAQAHALTTPPAIDLKLLPFERDLRMESEVNSSEAFEYASKKHERGLGDCVSVWPTILPALLLSERAYACIHKYAAFDGQFFPVQVEETKFHLFNCTKVLNCLDVGQSEISLLSSGLPERVLRYAFNESIQSASIFFRIIWPTKTRQLLPYLFANDRLKELVDDNDLTGFRLRELRL
jgi:hypothetical protein